MGVTSGVVVGEGGNLGLGADELWRKGRLCGVGGDAGEQRQRRGRGRAGGNIKVRLASGVTGVTTSDPHGASTSLQLNNGIIHAVRGSSLSPPSPRVESGHHLLAQGTEISKSPFVKHIPLPYTS